jgi:hypothetical protein
MGMFQKIGGSWAFFAKVFGLHIAVGKWFGNCFAPALVVEWHGVRSGEWRHATARRAVAKYTGDANSYWQKVLAEPNYYIMPSWATITLRTRNFAETKIRFRGWMGFSFDSEHIAEKFGKAVDAPHGTCYFYKGWMGNHSSL